MITTTSEVILHQHCCTQSVFPARGTMNSFADLISLAGVGVGGHVFGLANGTQAQNFHQDCSLKCFKAAPHGTLVILGQSCISSVLPLVLLPSLHQGDKQPKFEKSAVSSPGHISRASEIGIPGASRGACGEGGHAWDWLLSSIDITK